MVTRFTPWSAEDPDNPTPAEIVTKTSPITDRPGLARAGLPRSTRASSPGPATTRPASYSPFNIRLTRNDAEQEFSRFSVKLPKGVIGKFAGVPFCPDAAIAAARARSGPLAAPRRSTAPAARPPRRSGAPSPAPASGPTSPTCPARLYLAGPYKGAPLSIVAITPAKVGPFDLGTVVVRKALRVDPETAEVTATARARTRCRTSSTASPSTLATSGSTSTAPTSPSTRPTANATATAATMLARARLRPADDAVGDPPFQAADCAALGFKPKLSLQLKGGTRRTGHPALKAVLTPRRATPTSAAAQVTLPRSEFLDQAHIRTVCTRVQFTPAPATASSARRARSTARPRRSRRCSTNR